MSLKRTMSDPSSVLHVCVYGGGRLLGQWMTTAKWLLLDPTNCEHSALHRSEDTISGWFVLADEKWLNLGRCGELHLSITWSAAEASAAASITAQPSTALEQLSLKSAETALRLGDMRGVRRFLSSLPYLLAVRQITVREIQFYVKDLFMGVRGQVEAGQKPDCVRIPRLDSSEHLLIVIQYQSPFQPRIAAGPCPSEDCEHVSGSVTLH